MSLQRGRGKEKGPSSRKGTDTEPDAKRMKMDDQLIIEENEEDCFVSTVIHFISISTLLFIVQAFQIAFKDIFQTDSRSLSLTTEQRVGNFELLPNPLIIIHALSSSRFDRFCVFSFNIIYSDIFYSDPYHLTKVLRETHPRTIIMYDSDVKFVRQIEVIYNRAIQ